MREGARWTMRSLVRAQVARVTESREGRRQWARRRAGKVISCGAGASGYRDGACASPMLRHTTLLHKAPPRMTLLIHTIPLRTALLIHTTPPLLPPPLHLSYRPEAIFPSPIHSPSPIRSPRGGAQRHRVSRPTCARHTASPPRSWRSSRTTDSTTATMSLSMHTWMSRTMYCATMSGRRECTGPL